MPSKTRKDEVQGPPVGKTDWAAFDALTDEVVEAAARADPDCPPLSGDQTMHRMAHAKRVRLKLGLSQQEFAYRFHIPFSTVAAWERHEAEPDAVAIAFLDAIAADPEGLENALSRSSGKPAAE